MRIVDVCSDIESAYQEYIAQKGECSRIAFLLFLASAVSKETGTVTIETADNIIRTKQIIESKRKDAPVDTHTGFDCVISLLELLYPCVLSICGRGMNAFDFFNSVNVETFEDVELYLKETETFSRIPELSQFVDEFSDNVGKPFASIGYENGLLKWRIAEPFVDNTADIFKSKCVYVSCNDTLERLLEAFKAVPELPKSHTMYKVLTRWKTNLETVCKLNGDGACILMLSDKPLSRKASFMIEWGGKEFSVTQTHKVGLTHVPSDVVGVSYKLWII